MNNAILILGESGRGKTHSTKTLDPATTFFINVSDKPLPFKGWKNLYTPFRKEGDTWVGNLYSSANVANIIKVIDHVNKDNKIKTIVIDDSQYVMSFEFMDKALEKGYDKFTSMAKNFYTLVSKGKSLRDDLTIFFLHHVETSLTVQGDKVIKAKTVGKLVDEKITLEGLFTVVLMAQPKVDPNGNIEYGFITKNDGNTTVKSPEGMFDDFIPNDLEFVRKKILEFEQ